MSSEHSSEVHNGERFQFGDNWLRYSRVIDEERIQAAEKSLAKMLKVSDLREKRFIDIGSGSGLFSLGATRLGAKVHSIDYDPNSVACTQHLKTLFAAGNRDWTIEEGSVLDPKYIDSLGKWDVVYSWGVLHHTGSMYEAISNAARLVDDNGTLFISIYNDQGRSSEYWLSVKKAYNKLPSLTKWLVLLPALARLWGPTTIKDLLRGRPFHSWRAYSKSNLRGMSPWRDVVDWVGGLPFEVAKPEEIFEFLQPMGFNLVNFKTCGGGIGCNEFVFVKVAT